MQRSFFVLFSVFLTLSVIACNKTSGGGSQNNAPAAAQEVAQKEITALRENAPQEVATASDSAHNSNNALDWAGVYKGVIPAADGEGINVQITLNDNGTYQAAYQYIGKSDEIFNVSGVFKWSGGGRFISLDTQEIAPNYQVGENALLQLDMEGKRIAGALADNYTLRK